MSHEVLGDTAVATVDQRNDEFRRLFPLATQQPVWQVAQPSTLSAVPERLRRTRLQTFYMEFGVDLARTFQFRRLSNSVATSDAANTGSWITAPATENGKTSAQPTPSVDLSNLEPRNFIRAIRHALAAGEHVHARRLAIQATGLYPEHIELAKMAHILARPTAVRRNSAPDNSARANQLWLKQNFEDYKDRWVALRNGELVAVAETARDLKASITDLAGIMVTRV